jgi:hypothetical protein
MAARCIPRRRRPRPPRAPIPLVVSAARSTLTGPSSGGFVQAAIDTLAASGHRPPWLSPELLAVLEVRGRLVGLVYLLHFDRPIGDLTNPRGFAAHYTGWTLDLPGRLQDHAAGRGARLMEVGGRGRDRLAARPRLARHPRPRTLPQRLGWGGPSLPGLPAHPPRPRASSTSRPVGVRGRRPRRRLHRPAVRAPAAGAA